MSIIIVSAARTTITTTRDRGTLWNEARPVLEDAVTELVLATTAAGVMVSGALLLSALQWRVILRRPPTTAIVLVAGGMSLTALLLLQSSLQDSVGIASVIDQHPYRGAVGVFNDYQGQLAVWARALVGSIIASGASLAACIGLMLPDRPAPPGADGIR